MINVNVKAILKAKEDCILDIAGLINRQLGLLESARSGEIPFNEFKKEFDDIEFKKEFLIEFKYDCDLLIDCFTNLIND